MQADRANGFPMTIVRPSHTYDTIVPVAVGRSDYTIVNRLRRGKPVVVHGEGTSLWTLTTPTTSRAPSSACAATRARSATRSTSRRTSG